MRTATAARRASSAAPPLTGSRGRTVSMVAPAAASCWPSPRSQPPALSTSPAQPSPAQPTPCLPARSPRTCARSGPAPGPSPAPAPCAAGPAPPAPRRTRSSSLGQGRSRGRGPGSPRSWRALPSCWWSEPRPSRWLLGRAGLGWRSARRLQERGGGGAAGPQRASSRPAARSLPLARARLQRRWPAAGAEGDAGRRAVFACLCLLSGPQSCGVLPQVRRHLRLCGCGAGLLHQGGQQPCSSARRRRQRLPPRWCRQPVAQAAPGASRFTGGQGACSGGGEPPDADLVLHASYLGLGGRMYACVRRTYAYERSNVGTNYAYVATTHT
jgi:hypothetical protein